MSECDLIDLASVERTQSEGFLVSLYPGQDSCRIRNVSSNICEAPFSARVLRDDPRQFIGKPLNECFSSFVSKKCRLC